MATQYVYPSNIELGTIDQAFLPVLASMDPIFSLFPIREKDTALVAWEQRDNYRGLMQLRGYEAPYPSVPVSGVNRYAMDPGVYGEHDPITEQEITQRKGFGSLGTPINIKDLVTERHEKLATRHFNRMSWVLWTILTKGVYIIPTPTGTVAKRDAFTPQTYTATTAWVANPSTSAPLGDFRAVQLKHRGVSVNLGSSASAFMNRVTFNGMIANTNANDLGGRRTNGLASIEGLDDFNKLAMKDDLPQVQVWDEGYLSDGTDGNTAGTFVPFIPDNTVVVVGRRTNGAPVGEFQLTRNASNPNESSQPLVKVVDTGAGENEPPPRVIKVYRGFNGGPSLFYPSSIVIMSV